NSTISLGKIHVSEHNRWHFNGDDETWRWVCNWQNWTQADKDRWINCQ
ncbi:unnamed protein product, partial [Rotaria socialis]